MHILWFTWKDTEHPLAGGAEVVNEELARRLVRDGHSVTMIVGGWKGCVRELSRNGIRIIRLGNRYTVYMRAFFYFRRHLYHWPDLVIEEINTIPFFTRFFIRYSQHSHSDSPIRINNPHSQPIIRPPAGKTGNIRTILFIHQLCREIWFYELPFPLSLIGYFLEPLYLRLLNDQPVITISASTTCDLLRYGFKPGNIRFIPEGIALTPLPQVISNKLQVKSNIVPADHISLAPVTFTILALGAVRAMKRTDHIIKAFEIIKQKNDFRLSTSRLASRAKRVDLRLIIAGSTESKYAKNVLRMIAQSPCKDDITVLGRVSDEQKLGLLRTSHLLCVTSVKEGWGLVVTEAASQGTPAVVYDVDGLRDAVQHGEAGFICEKNTPQCLAENIMKILSNPHEYERIRQNAWEWSRTFTFERSYQAFKQSLTL